MDWIEANKAWLFSGLGVFVLGFIFSLFNKKEPKKESNIPTIQSTNNSGVQNSNTGHSNTQIVQNFGHPNMPITDAAITPKQKLTTLELKSKTRILFIDDMDFPIVRNLKKAGWNTDLVHDIYDIDDNLIVASHILFVDINGVAKTLSAEEGLGLVKAIKRKYGNTKKVIIYSSEQEGDRFNEAFQLADASLPKESDYFEFLAIVDKYSEEVFNS